MPRVVVARELTKHYGPVRALQGLDIHIQGGEVYALLGPNGAGKTTAVSLITGLRRPTSGEIRLFGRNPRERIARTRLGAMLQDARLPALLTVAELLEAYRAFYPRPWPLAEIAEIAGLGSLLNWRVERLSAGQRRKVALGLALAGGPELLVLDEPTTGLDVEARLAFWGWIQTYVARGGAVLLTTHNLEEAERLAHRIGVITNGRIVAEGSPPELRVRAGRYRVQFRTPSGFPEAGVAALPGVLRLGREGQWWVLDVSRPELVIAELVRQGTLLEDLRVEGGSLERAYLELIEGAR